MNIDDLNTGVPDELRPAGLSMLPAGPGLDGTAVAGPQRRQAEEPHLLDYARIVVKRRYIAISAFVVIALLTAVYTFTATPVYEGQVQLLIESDNPNVVSFKQVIDEEQSRQDYYQTQHKLLQSRSLARNTIDELKLWNDPELRPDPAHQKLSLGNAMRGGAAWVASLFVTAPAAEVPAANETVSQSKAIDAFLARLNVSPVRNSRLVEVSFRSTNAKQAASVANGLAKAYINQSLDVRYSATREASDWLAQQLEEQRKQVETAESALQQYRESHDAISFDSSQNIVTQKLADLNAAVTRAKTDRLQKESMYRQLQEIQNQPDKLDTFPAILMNNFIQQQKGELASLERQRAQLSEKLAEKHPDMVRLQSAIDEAQRRLQVEIAKVIQGVRTEYEAAQAQERAMVGALDAQKAEALGMNRKAIEYSVLQRDVDSSKQIYQVLMQRAKETGVSGELKTSNIRVVDNAEVATKPVSPKTTLNLLLGIFGGAFIGIGLAFFFEYLDHHVKTPEEIEMKLGLPSLGLIPKINYSDGNPLINNGVPANFAEAFRGLRTNILFSNVEEGSRTLVVTSTGPSEGKTMVASNLAVGMAQAGQRVLLIDADMRRPRSHEVFSLKVDPGLSNLLVGAAKASEVVQRSAVPGLWVLPAGKTPPNPAELIGSKRFAELLNSLKEHFDLIVIDTPPVMAVTDAAIAAHRAHGVLFVIAADQTSRHAAQQALDQLEHARARFVGAVLNRVDLDKNAYYYSRYYRKEYAAYYQSAS
jgi:capsular exopolysaccharide synthesis family protein